MHPIVQLIELAGNAPSSGSLAVAVRVTDWHTANLALAGGDVMVTMGGRLPAGTVWLTGTETSPRESVTTRVTA